MFNRHNVEEPISCRQWTSAEPPRRILVIRMHAIGDVAITLPGISAIQRHLPNARVDFLTTNACTSFFDSFSLSGDVFPFPDRMNHTLRLTQAIWFGRRLHQNKYDVVIDLQRNWASRLVRRLVAPQSWAEFERFTSKPAADRVLETLRRVGFQGIELDLQLPIKKTALDSAKSLLLANGWTRTNRIIILNPAGLWQTRQWPLQNYISLAKMLREEEGTQFLLLGTERIREKARHIESALTKGVINLVGRTTLGEALALLRFVHGIVTEDSGLMHMAWASGVSTVALFGSTNHVWSAPTGIAVRSFDSGDLPCGACMQPACRFGDVHCLARVTPEEVYNTLKHLLASRRTIAGTPSHART